MHWEPAFHLFYDASSVTNGALFIDGLAKHGVYMVDMITQFSHLEEQWNGLRLFFRDAFLLALVALV